MDHAVDAGREHPCCEDGFVQVLERIGPLHFVGSHCACQDDGDAWAGDALMESFSRDGEGVGAMEDDDTIAVWLIHDGLNGLDDAFAVIVGEVEAVLGEQLNGMDRGIDNAEATQHAWDDASGVGERAGEFVVGLFNGSAG